MQLPSWLKHQLRSIAVKRVQRIASDAQTQIVLITHQLIYISQKLRYVFEPCRLTSLKQVHGKTSDASTSMVHMFQSSLPPPPNGHTIGPWAPPPPLDGPMPFGGGGAAWPIRLGDLSPLGRRGSHSPGAPRPGPGA